MSKQDNAVVRVAFPEWDNPIIQQAIQDYDPEVSGVEPVSCQDLAAACAAVKAGVADALVTGIDYTSREVILACRDIIGTSDKTFSASFWLKKSFANDHGGKDSADLAKVDTNTGPEYVIGDAAACKNPTESQLYDITMQTYQTAKKLLADTPRVALLSFSTLGSGGKDPSIERVQNVVRRIRAEHPEILIDGELQLDAAVSSRVAAKKAPHSSVAGKANVLIAPDLNSGNILYKAMEQFGNMTAAGPLLQGFKAPISDLSRGSTVNDVRLVFEAIKKLAYVEE